MGRRRKNKNTGSASENESDVENGGNGRDFEEEYAPQKKAVILFFDVDSFEVQVWGREQGYSPEVLQKETFVCVNELDVITAVNYPAKAMGVWRAKECTLEMAKDLCPQLKVLRIPNHFGKPDALLPRKASDEILEAIYDSLTDQCTLFPDEIPLEKASKDEFFIDITGEVFHRVYRRYQRVPTGAQVAALKQTKCILEAPRYSATGDRLSYRTLQVLTNDNIIQDRHLTEALLMHGAVIANGILEKVRQDTGFVMSGGVSSNKLLAKLGCGHHKPAGLAVLPQSSLGRMAKKISVTDIPGLGGERGQKLLDRGIHTMSNLAHLDRVKLMKIMESETDGLKFHQLAIGYDPSVVVDQMFNATLKCGITFSYKTRRMGTPDEFKIHLWNRFLELRDHIMYDVHHHGTHRIPKSITLEINTRKCALKTAFKATEELPSGLVESITTNVVNGEWTRLQQRFLGLLVENKDLNPLDPLDYEAACAAVRKISEISLKAKYHNAD